MHAGKLVNTVAAVVVIVLMSGTALAATNLENFDTMTAGATVNGQNGWTVADEWGYTLTGTTAVLPPNNDSVIDESVVNIAPGNNVWRVSNAYTNTGYSAMPYSQTSPQVAGAPGSYLWNNFGSDHTSPLSPPLSAGASATTNLFSASFDFMSATGAAQPGLAIQISPGAKQGQERQGLLYITDNGSTGYNIAWNDDYSPPNHTVATVPYNTWTNVAIYDQFVPGVTVIGGNDYSNDIVEIFVNGQLDLTATDWAGWYAQETATTPWAVNSLLFRVTGTADPAALGEGFYFDNVSVGNDPAPAVPEPISMIFFGTGIVSVWGYVARRRMHRS